MTAALVAILGGGVTEAAGILVNTTSVATNGDVSSPTALEANPGPDSISLPEAVAAANNAVEPQTITFANDLAGKTISLAFPLVLTRDGTTLTGLTGPDGHPDLTVDAGQARQFHCALHVLASDVIISRIRFVGQYFDGICVLAGSVPQPPPNPQPRQEVRNVVVENNIFEDAGSTQAVGAAVRVYMEPEARSSNASIENVRIIGNRFLNFSEGVGVNVAANGFGCLIRDVVIEKNTFFNIRLALAVETAHGSNNQVLGTRITGNTFIGAYPQPTLFIAHLVDPPPSTGNAASGNMIDETLIDRNVFLGSASVLILGGQENVSSSSVTNIDFVNNVMNTTGTSDISVVGGKAEAVRNRVDGVRFANNTLMTDVRVVVNEDRASGNNISRLTFRNTIFRPEGSIRGLEPSSVSYSLIQSPEFADNNNKSGDPRFVDRANGDFHLRSDSPAVDGGTPDGAPEADAECRPRVSLPDMGAYEYAAPLVARLFLRIERGRGSVGVVPAGLPCGSAKSFLIGSVVELTAMPSPGWRFESWGGDPDCLDGVVTMASDKTCVATFSLEVVVPNPRALVNGASFAPAAPVTPGSIASLFGSNLASTSATAPGLPLPTILAGASVRFEGISAPLFFASPSQVNLQVPWELAGEAQATLTAALGEAVGSPLTVSLAPYAPAIFTVGESGQGAILIAGTGSLAATEGSFLGARPARRGEFLSIYGTGLGQVTNQPPTGAPASSEPLATTTTIPVVTLGGVSAPVSFSGLAPGLVGLYQVNVEVPESAPIGNAIPLVLTIGGIASNIATVAIQ
ncbi:MAG: hypothetical protein HY316_06480 [Acidobacteria bacterium]|nr:hypothetical protein [Acidobacteriota bacterium]